MVETPIRLWGGLHFYMSIRRAKDEKSALPRETPWHDSRK